MPKWFVWLCRIVAIGAIFFGIIPLTYGIFRTGVVVLLLFGAVLMGITFWKLPPTGWLRTLHRLLSLALIVFTVGGAGLSAVMAYAAWFSPPDGAPATVIVLGCQAKNGRPSLMLSRRIDAAAAYLLKHPGTPVIATGGLDSPSETLTEAQVIRQELIARGISSERIYTDNHSTDTRENLKFAAQILRDNALPESVLIATDSFHLLRGHLYARKNALSPASLPCKTSWGLLPSYWVREWFGLVKAFVLKEF